MSDKIPRAFLAVARERPADADAAAELRTEDGAPQGFLAAWLDAKRPREDAVRVDPRVVDPRGDPMLCSLVLPDGDVSLDFDDPAVVGATRAALGGVWPDLLTTFVRAGYRFAGALTGVRTEARRWRLEADPFAAIFGRRIVRVGPGLLARVPAPTGPVTQRYGAGNPWPWDRFDTGRGID